MDPEETSAVDVPKSEQETAVATIVPRRKTDGERKKRRVPRYHVILWDSDHHTYEYVERMLRELFGHEPETCHQMAVKVDTEGKVIVLTTTKEHAELKRDQIVAYGKDDLIRSCTGSMHATIESAD